MLAANMSASIENEIRESVSDNIVQMNINVFRGYAGSNTHSPKVRRKLLSVVKLCERAVAAEPTGITEEMMDRLKLPENHRYARDVFFGSQPKIPKVTQAGNARVTSTPNCSKVHPQGRKELDRELSIAKASGIHTPFVEGIEALRTHHTPQEVAPAGEGQDIEQTCDGNQNSEMTVSSSQKLTLIQTPRLEDERIGECQHETVQDQEPNERQNEKAEDQNGKDLNEGPAQEDVRMEECQHENIQEHEHEEHQNEISKEQDQRDFVINCSPIQPQSDKLIIDSPIFANVGSSTSPLVPLPVEIGNKMEVCPYKLPAQAVSNAKFFTLKPFASAVDNIRENQEPTIANTLPMSLPAESDQMEVGSYKLPRTEGELFSSQPFVSAVDNHQDIQERLIPSKPEAKFSSEEFIIKASPVSADERSSTSPLAEISDQMRFGPYQLSAHLVSKAEVLSSQPFVSAVEYIQENPEPTIPNTPSETQFSLDALVGSDDVPENPEEWQDSNISSSNYSEPWEKAEDSANDLSPVLSILTEDIATVSEDLVSRTDGNVCATESEARVRVDPEIVRISWQNAQTSLLVRSRMTSLEPSSIEAEFSSEAI